MSGKYCDERGTWYVKKNIQLAEGVAIELWQLGYAVICPHANSAFFEGPIDDAIIVAGDCELVRRSDGLVVCPNWATSSGTRMEWQAAYDTGMPIFYWNLPEDHEALKAWSHDEYDLQARLMWQRQFSTIESLAQGER